MTNTKPRQFIYLVGEHQTAIVEENQEMLAFTQQHMQQVDSAELALALANVYGKGQMFPGPEGVVTSILHEFVRRSELYANAIEKGVHDRLSLITAFKRLDGEIATQVAAVIPVPQDALSLERPESFHALLIESLPDFQQAFTTEAYAGNSKLIALIKEATLYHINQKLK